MLVPRRVPLVYPDLTFASPTFSGRAFVFSSLEIQFQVRKKQTNESCHKMWVVSISMVFSVVEENFNCSFHFHTPSHFLYIMATVNG